MLIQTSAHLSVSLSQLSVLALVSLLSPLSSSRTLCSQRPALSPSASALIHVHVLIRLSFARVLVIYYSGGSVKMGAAQKKLL